MLLLDIAGYPQDFDGLQAVIQVIAIKHLQQVLGVLWHTYSLQN